MSRENVEIMRAGFAAWNAGDMAAVREAFDPEVIMRTPEGWPEPGPYVGREAVLRQLDQNRATWDTDTFEPISDFIDAADRVVLRAVWHGTGRGPDSNIEFTHVFTLRNGKIVFIEYFWDHQEALETLGLSAAEPLALTQDDSLRQSIEGVNNRDSALIEAVCDPDFELRSSFSAVEGKTYRGYDGAKAYLSDMQAAWEDFHITIEESTELGEAKAIVVLRLEGVGRGSGVPFDQLTYGVYDFRGGKVWRARFSASREEALEVAALPE